MYNVDRATQQQQASTAERARGDSRSAPPPHLRERQLLCCERHGMVVAASMDVVMVD
jgi:hypothetical protein